MVGLLAPNRLNITIDLSISSGRAIGFTLVRGVSAHHLFTPARGVSPQTLKIPVYSCARCLTLTLGTSFTLVRGVWSSPVPESTSKTPTRYPNPVHHMGSENQHNGL